MYNLIELIKRIIMRTNIIFISDLYINEEQKTYLESQVNSILKNKKISTNYDVCYVNSQFKYKDFEKIKTLKEPDVLNCPIFLDNSDNLEYIEGVIDIILKDKKEGIHPIVFEIKKDCKVNRLPPYKNVDIWIFDNLSDVLNYISASILVFS